MKTLYYVTARNMKLFFKDKGMFFTSLITPLILLVLFFTFLGNVYRDTFLSFVPDGVQVPAALADGFVGGWLLSSMLAVCCVTVAFCSNMQMVQDKVSGAEADLSVAPVKRSTLALGYFLSAAFTTLIICGAALCAGLFYLWQAGWYLTLSDVLLLLLDTVLLVLFGTALSSLVNGFLSTQGQLSAVGTIVSSCYGFICGAYMPLSQFSEGLRNVISFLPGTYGTALIRHRLMDGVFAALEDEYLPAEAVETLREAFDGRLSLLGTEITQPMMYAVLGVFTVLLLAACVLLHIRRGKRSAA
ncbi:MAG: ABC transporter permease [Acutalibacteraceae bacterium]